MCFDFDMAQIMDGKLYRCPISAHWARRVYEQSEGKDFIQIAGVKNLRKDSIRNFWNQGCNHGL